MSDTDFLTPTLVDHPALTDSALRWIPYWSPGIEPINAKNRPNSSLRIAGIVGTRLYEGLRHEGHLSLLTPRNADRVLRFGKPDLLLVESSWTTATGHWYMAQTDHGLGSRQLLEVLRIAKHAGVPTAYWVTAGHEYHMHFRNLATAFDHVFCADSIETALLRSEGIPAHDLPPCVQPAVHNPFRRPEDVERLQLGVVYDGLADVVRNERAFSSLHEVKRDHELGLIESRYIVDRSSVDRLENLRDSVLGCVTRISRIAAIQAASASISFENSVSTSTTQKWMALETAAMHCPSIHFGQIEEEDIRASLVTSFADPLDSLVELIRVKEDPLYGYRKAHAAWRETLEKHTFSHRLRTIAEVVGLNHDWEEFPRATIITPTMRPQFVENAVATYLDQTYPNKELVLVCNGFHHQDLQVPQGGVNDIKVLHLPQDLFAGAAMNLGMQASSGKWTFRLDDDDTYGSNFILDMMLWERCYDADIMGKAETVPMRFEGHSDVFFGASRDFILATGKELAGTHYISGNSISLRRSVDSAPSYLHNAATGADGFLKLNTPEAAVVLIGDFLNAVAERRSEIHEHSWKAESEELRRGKTAYPGIEDFLL